MPAKPRPARRPSGYLCEPCKHGQHRSCVGSPAKPCRCTHPVHRRKTDPGAR